MPCVGGAAGMQTRGLAQKASYTPVYEGAKRIRLVACPASATEATQSDKKLSSGRLQQLLQTLSDAKTASSNIVTSRLSGRTATTSAARLMQSPASTATAASPAALPLPAAEEPVRVPVLRQSRPLPPPVPENQPVLDLIHRRMQDGSMPGCRRDGFKLGLVVEGGGMRGIVTGAMLMGLLDIGARETFDAVYGASAGAINGCYFLSGQCGGLDIYMDHLAVGDTFLSLKRYWRRNGPPVMNLDYLLDHIMETVEPLDWDAVIRSPVPLKVVASSLTSLQSEVLQDFTDPSDLKECLKASANVPEIVGGPRFHRGHSLVDAAVFEPIPIKAALADGCTHVLALCSRPPNVGSAWGKVVKSTLMTAVKRIALNPPYMREAWRVEAQQKMLQGLLLEDALLQMVEAQPAQAAETLGRDGGDEGGHIYPVYPGFAASFAPICTNVDTLRLGRQEGMAAVLRLLRPVSARAR